MITLTDDLNGISLPDTAPKVRIFCTAAAYITFPKIALFWKQTDINGKATALLCLMDGCLTLTQNGGDASELCEFLKMLSPASIFTEKSTAQHLKLAVTKEVSVLKLSKDKKLPTPCENTYEGLNSLYLKLSSCFQGLDEMEFIADMSHRVRHNCAAYVTTPFSAAVLQYTPSLALVTGIATQKEKRSSGIGSNTLARLVNSVRGKDIFACTDSATQQFYLKNGFALCEPAVFCEVNVNE